jgi:uncharacterized protein (DUF488 family)
MIWTVGHGTISADQLIDVLDGGGVQQIVDVRSFPGSRHNPQFGQDEMTRWVPAAGRSYRWMRRLGGRRRPVSGSKHIALRNASFRAYADHMETEEFLGGVDELMESAAQPTAVMCSESVWWRCHRRLLADHLVLVRQIEVVHLMHDGRHTAHVPTDGVRLAGGTLVYDGAQAHDPASRAQG